MINQIDYYLLVILTIYLLTINKYATTVLISSPFDNFRIECPQSSGVQRLSIRIIESQGLKRQDVMYALSCSRINELYPWAAMPAEVQELEHEDCHYSASFDPILDLQFNYTCKNNEYLTGISRIADTKIQVECCRLRSRKEISCSEYLFSRLDNVNSRIEIEFNGKLINSIKIENNAIVARFCDLTPRPFDSILADIATTTKRYTIPNKATTITKPTHTPISTEKTSDDVIENLAAKRIIKVKQKTSLSDNWPTELPINTLITTNISTPIINNINQNNNKQKTNNENIEKVSEQQTTAAVELKLTHEQENNELDEYPFENPLKDVISKIEKNNLEILPVSFNLTTKTNNAHIQNNDNNDKETDTQLPFETVNHFKNFLQKSTKTKELQKLELTPIKNMITTTTTLKSILDTSSLTETLNSIKDSDSNNQKLLSEKDYENIDDVASKLMKSIAAISDEKKQINLKHIKAANLYQIPRNNAKSEELTERALKELLTDNDKTDKKLKKSNEKSLEDIIDEIERMTKVEYDEDKQETPLVTTDIISTKKYETYNRIYQTTKSESLNRKQTLVTTIKPTESITLVVPTKITPLLNTIEHEKILSLPPNRHLHAQIVSHSKSLLIQPESLSDELIQLNLKNKIEHKKLETSNTVINTKEELAPFNAFPSPPPNSQFKVPFRNLPQLRKITSKVISTTLATTLGLIKKIVIDNENFSNVKNNNKNNEQNVDYSVEDELQSSTEAPIITSTATTKQKFSSHLITFEGEFVTPSTLINHKTSIKQSLKNKNIEIDALVGGPYVDEETKDSPFDANHQPVTNSNKVTSQKKQQTVPQKKLNGATLKYEAELLQRQQQQNEKEEKNKNTAIEVKLSSSNGNNGRSRFEQIESRFNKQSPFDALTEIRRAPRPHISSFYKNNQETIENEHNRRKQNQMIQPIYNKDEIVSDNKDLIGINSLTSPINFQPKNKNNKNMTIEFSENQVQLKDGIKNFVPENNTPVQMPDIIIYDTIDSKNLPQIVQKKETENRQKKLKNMQNKNVIINNLILMDKKDEITQSLLQREEIVSTNPILNEEPNVYTLPSKHSTKKEKNKVNQQRKIQSQKNTETSIKELQQMHDPNDITIEEYYTRPTLEPPATPAPYNLASFYHVPNHKRKLFIKEKVLTFCSKETAIRDSNNLIIACGGDDNVWQPNRCPPSTECFQTADSTYRICCPVA